MVSVYIQDNNLERAVDWIFNHPDEIGQEEQDTASATEPQYVDGAGSMYKLVNARNREWLFASTEHLVTVLCHKQH